MTNIDSQRTTPVSTENLLSRVNNNSGSNDRTVEDENGYCDNKPNSGAKLHQLLDASPRADAVAAGWYKKPWSCSFGILQTQNYC